LSSHGFAIGQAVRLRPAFGLSTKPAQIYRIIGLLPERDNSPQYRVRSDEERHDRVLTEDGLEDMPAVVDQR
jgi:hypothetical protein